MNRTVTIEIIDNAALRFLRELAAIRLIRFTPESTSADDHITAIVNEICDETDTSLDPDLMAAQLEVIGKEDR